MKSYILTPAAGKRLIAKALAVHPAVQSALDGGTLVIVAGTTNGYVAEEILTELDQAEGFFRPAFIRGVTLPPLRPAGSGEEKGEDHPFPGDVVIMGGVWQKGKTVFEVADELKEGDLILKGANALDYPRRRAAVLIGHPKAGTIGASLPAVVGRRVGLILPVGLEKRIDGDLDLLAAKLNQPGAKGPRLLPVAGTVFTEIEALALLTGATAELVASGGVSGAEGSIWLAVEGTATELAKADELLRAVSPEPQFQVQ